MLVLSRLAEARSGTGRFAPAAVDRLYDELGLPRPPRVSAILANLGGRGMVAHLKAPGTWRLTPLGRARSGEAIGEMDLAALSAEASIVGGPDFGHTLHPLIPPAFAPPELLEALRAFLVEYPFDLNVFGMTRFPDDQDGPGGDPVGLVIEVVRDACSRHGMSFHLASDRVLVDDLWANVTAHVWGSRYGIAFFEDRRGRGLNYNLTIEVGSMLVLGRRCALLKDDSISQMPTDLVGKIYKPVDFGDPEQAAIAIHSWLRDDLRLGTCARCA